MSPPANSGSGRINIISNNLKNKNSSLLITDDFYNLKRNEHMNSLDN